jgi:hypothetical protein
MAFKRTNQCKNKGRKWVDVEHNGEASEAAQGIEVKAAAGASGTNVGS